MDQRATWDNSPELREKVKRELINWGWHYRGRAVDLGYPSHQPFTTAPAKDQARPPEYLGPDEAESAENHISSAAQASSDSRKKAEVLAVEFARGSWTQHSKAKFFRVSRRTYGRMLDEAMFWYWFISGGRWL